MKSNLHICSLNCQGLGNKDKRLRVYEWMKYQKCDILYTQETHFDKNVHKQYKNEYTGTIYSNFGTSKSRGVSILFDSSVEHKIIDEHKDQEGRIILLNIEMYDSIYSFINIYAPNDEKNRNSFFKKVNNIIDKHSLGLLVIGGDMNNTLTEKDRKSKSQNKKPKIVYYLKQLIKKHKLSDIWRELHPGLRQFTWRRKNNNNESSRIDYFLICPNLRPKIFTSDIRPAMISSTDHMAISLKIDCNHHNRGRGYFKLNNSILSSDKYNILIRKLIHKYKEKIEQSNDPRILWDVFKVEVRDLTIEFCRKQSREKQNELNLLENKLKRLQTDIDNGLIYNVKEKEDIEKKIETIYNEKANGAKIRSRAKWLEEGEKNNRFFLGLEKARQTRKSITSLKDKNGTIIHDNTQILEMQREYYENLYTASNINTNELQNYIENTKIDHKLSKRESESLEGELTLDECTKAVFSMKLNKSPGIDGITVEFYRNFWEDLKVTALNIFNSCYKFQELTDIQKIGALSLIYKKNDPLDLNNYRPITLLNIDTKIIAYALAQRIKPVLANIINSDQNGYIKNRYIGYNIRQIQDIIDYADNLNIEGAILFLDFSKAFDSLEWEFMYCSLVKFGFQNSMLRWVKTLYNDIKGCIVNNGWISRLYKISRGIRQGCPLSALLFVISVEILACRIRQDNDIKGFTFKMDGRSRSIKISQMADDTTIFVNSKEDVGKALNIIEEFGSFSGLKLNRNKTEGLWIGKLKHCKEKIENICWAENYVKCLGVYFGHNKNECKKLNINKQIEKSANIINQWGKRNLSMIGKITVVKSLIIPNITYVASVTTLDKETISKFKSIIYDFIWNGKSEKVKRQMICKDITEGGLKMIDIDKYIEAIKIGWVNKLTDNTEANWKVIPKLLFNKIGKNFLVFKMNIDNLTLLPTYPSFIYPFYLDILKIWTKNKKEIAIPKNYRSIRQELIWGNKFIKFNGKCLLYNKWIYDNILYINDIIDENGNVNETIIFEKLSNKSNWMTEIIRLKRAIPKNWLTILKTEQSVKTQVRMKEKILLRNSNIEIMKSKDIYRVITTSDINDLPTGFLRWIKEFENSQCDIKLMIKQMLIFSFRHLDDNKLKMFRWKILHYILPNKKLLFQWKIANTPFCNFCKTDEESYLHFFVECRYLAPFWSKIKNLFSKLNLGYHILTFRHLIL